MYYEHKSVFGGKRLGKICYRFFFKFCYIISINVALKLISLKFYMLMKYICAFYLEIVSELNHSVLGLGLDTLEEQEEKEQFFARLEKGLTSSIDYSRLNKELDSNDSIHFKALHR